MEAYVDEITPIAMMIMVALFSGLAMMRLRQPAIVGYIFAGVLLGPTGLGVIENNHAVELLAELGVIMLLFLIGMELSLRGFKAIYKVAVATAGLQVAFSLAAFGGIGAYLDWSFAKILVFGFAFSLSSTAVAVKILEETGGLKTQVGRTAVGVLIAQDLAVIPMLLLIRAFGESGAAEGLSYMIFVKLAFAVGLLIWLSWFLSRRKRIRLPIIESIADRPDILPLAGLGICFTMATISGVFGLSTAYGAFIAGLVIGNSRARAAMHGATLPIQSVLLMVFFLSIGLLIDLKFVMENWALVLCVLAVVTVVKTAVNIFILRIVGETRERSYQIGTVLGQVGEFSFILATTALSAEIIFEPGYRLMITTIALSLMISPIWMSATRRLRDGGLPFLRISKHKHHKAG